MELPKNKYVAKREKKANGKTTGKIVKIAIFSVMGAACLSAALSVTALTKTVKITDGENTTVINTMNLDKDAILEQAGVKLGDNDKVVLTETSDNGVEVSIMRAFNVNLEADGNVKSIVFSEGTVADALKAANIKVDGADSVTPSATTALEPDMKIKIQRWHTISINDAGKTVSKDVPEGTVAEALEFLGIKLSPTDKLNVKSDSKVEDNLKIKIDRITHKTVQSKKAIAFKEVEKKTDELYTGETEVKTEGSKGTKLITSQETYVNGKLTSTKKIAEKTIKKAVNKVTLVGTAKRPEPANEVTGSSNSSTSSENYFNKNAADSSSFSSDSAAQTFTDMNGNTVKYLRSYTGSGTAYYAPAGSSTASGRPAQPGNVAVNPNLIPYGSKLYIVSNDGQVCYGYATAADTGGALFDGSAIVDLYYNTLGECTQFGRRDVTIYVLEEGDNAYVG
ncbi:MAG: ubiquitin-like domain-containing protein [Candidatus Pseudoruminococcus sp.]|uniref:ubiquitin-like domain-containing protein n=1 Tax=Candidatus Pseudoruminococcus sp. TaxID=3101048 RepID=UPI002A79C3B0|nr:ubiquitin-like domain-containing protein [Ruminococcus sp.]MDY2782050.1 ubiquitin-like domain-containing protein [Candidatus Pseudoruminococcus sp.]